MRMLTDGSGNVVARHDYLPFGEEIPAGYAGRSSSLLFGSSDGVEQKFTGQVRDSETGMDFFTARYYGSALERFISPDPANAGADATDPQSWNAYAYVRNNPLALVDPMGMCTFDAEGNAVEDENGACYEGGFGGSVTVTAQAPEEVPLIWVSFPSDGTSDQNPLPTPPPRLTESSLGAVQFVRKRTNTAPNGQHFTCPGDFAYYGNWGGPGWSGGQTAPIEKLSPQQQAALKPPIDAQDAAYQIHDYCYALARLANHHTAPCQGLTGQAAEAAATCDLQLEKNLLTVPLNWSAIKSIIVFPFHAFWNMYQGSVSQYPLVWVGIP